MDPDAEQVYGLIGVEGSDCVLLQQSLVFFARMDRD
jgi:hypothetical protein